MTKITGSNPPTMLIRLNHNASRLRPEPASASDSFFSTLRIPKTASSAASNTPVSINAQPNLLLDLAQWHAARGHWPATIPAGLKLANDTDIETLEADLPRLAAIYKGILTRLLLQVQAV